MVGALRIPGILAVAVSSTGAVAGGLLRACLRGLALWLSAFDVARRTVATDGLSRYMAVCLLTGYSWLAVAGIAWMAMGAGLPARDAALHASGVGFIVGMTMAHAPVILPALTGIRLRLGAWFWVPLVILQLSLVVRLGYGLADPLVRSLGAALNALALALFAAAILVGAMGARRSRRRLGNARTA